MQLFGIRQDESFRHKCVRRKRSQGGGGTILRTCYSSVPWQERLYKLLESLEIDDERGHQGITIWTDRRAPPLRTPLAGDLSQSPHRE